jgi:hypothetical protein
MFQNPNKCLTEIRLNPNFASLLNVEYKNENIEEAKPTDETTAAIRSDNSITAETFFRRFEKSIITKNGVGDVLPMNCRLVKSLGEGTVYIIEQPPMVRTVLVNHIDPFMLGEKYRAKEPFKNIANDEWFEANKKPPFKFDLAFPFVLFVMVYNKNMQMRTTRVYFRIAPLRDLNDYLLVPPINNLGSNQDVCIGNNDVFNIKNFSGVSDMIDNYIGTFWN